VKFALTVDGTNAALKKRADEVQQQRAAGKPTVPVSLGAEKQENPFLRADAPDLAGGLGMAGKPAAEVFAEIRGRKDRF
jgi:hydroxyacylglutathione hydrolase